MCAGLKGIASPEPEAVDIHEGQSKRLQPHKLLAVYNCQHCFKALAGCDLTGILRRMLVQSTEMGRLQCCVSCIALLRQ